VSEGPIVEWRALGARLPAALAAAVAAVALLALALPAPASASDGINLTGLHDAEGKPGTPTTTS
jgi:hypothetical protein